jgi:hypothetical protein
VLAYREQPDEAERVRLEAAVDRLFARVTGYDERDARIARTRANKLAVLQVLAHPERPLHNTASEVACRARVRKRLVSGGPRTAAGAKAWDTGMTIVETARKLGVSFSASIQDRISGAMQLPSLADLIAERAHALNLGASFSISTSPLIRPSPRLTCARHWRSSKACRPSKSTRLGPHRHRPRPHRHHGVARGTGGSHSPWWRPSLC